MSGRTGDVFKIRGVAPNDDDISWLERNKLIHRTEPDDDDETESWEYEVPIRYSVFGLTGEAQSRLYNAKMEGKAKWT